MKKLLLLSALFLLLPNVGYAATTWNPSDKSTNITLSGGDLIATHAANTDWAGVRGTVAKATGKWYWELTTGSGAATDGGIGLMTAATTLDGANYANPSGSYFFYPPGGGYYNNGSLVFATSNITVGDIVMFAYDADTGEIWGGVNGTWHNSGNPAAATGEIWTGAPASLYPMFGSNQNGGVMTVNFSATTAYTPPTGFSVYDALPAAVTVASVLASILDWFDS